MHDQPRYKPLARSAFFEDERAARPLVPDTVARGHLREDDLLHTGRIGEDLADAFPFPVDMRVLRRGRERFDVYCSPCHGQAGRGDGMVVRRGFKIRPANFHDEKLRAKPAGHYFDVITNGFGAMLDYAAQIPVRDRWAVVAYVRALQLSQNMKIDDLSTAQRAALEASAGPGGGHDAGPHEP